MNKIFQILPYAAIIIILLLWNGTCNSKKEFEDLADVANDSLQIAYNKLGEQTATISVFEASSKKAFLEMKTKDSTILRLQKLVKDTKRVQAAIVSTVKTESHISGETVVVNGTTEVSGDTVKIYPVYTYSVSDHWQDFSARMTKDSSVFKNVVYNEFDYTFSYEKRKLINMFKDPVLQIQATNKNPNTTTLELRAYDKKVDAKRGKFFLAGVGVGAILLKTAQVLLSGR